MPPPRLLLRFSGRFDDPLKRFRTLYAAEDRTTALMEVLAPFRPAAKLVAELTELCGPDSPEVAALGRVSRADLASLVLAQGEIRVLGGTLDLCSAEVRAEVAERHARLLTSFGVPHLDLTDMSSRQRAFTQELAAAVHGNDGIDVIRYPSNVSGRPCLALFEPRATLARTSRLPERLGEVPELAEVCATLRLTLAD